MLRDNKFSECYWYTVHAILHIQFPIYKDDSEKCSCASNNKTAILEKYSLLCGVTPNESIELYAYRIGWGDVSSKMYMANSIWPEFPAYILNNTSSLC